MSAAEALGDIASPKFLNTLMRSGKRNNQNRSI